MTYHTVYWKQHLMFLASIVITLISMFPIQLLLGAKYYTSNLGGYTDQPWYNLINMSNFILLHLILLILVALWVLWSGWKKSFVNSVVGSIISALATIIILLVVQQDWLYDCQDFCGFGTIFYMPFILSGMFCISLFFPSKP